MVTNREILEQILINQQAIMKILAETNENQFLKEIIENNGEMLKRIWGG